MYVSFSLWLWLVGWWVWRTEKNQSRTMFPACADNLGGGVDDGQPALVVIELVVVVEAKLGGVVRAAEAARAEGVRSCCCCSCSIESGAQN